MDASIQCNIEQRYGSKATIVRLPVVDIPDLLIVSTCMVNRKFISENAPDAGLVSFLNNGNILNTQKHSVKAAAMPLENNQNDSAVPVRMISCGTITDDDGLPPTRDRFTQTTDYNLCNTGVQCNMETIDWEDSQPLDNCVDVNKEEAKVLDLIKFQTFVEDKTYTYPNGNRECLICGEITVKRKTMRDHMAVHWGPSALCYRCGVKFEHRLVMRSHACIEQPGKGRRRYLCPHYQCNAVAISRLELYDHINEHTKEAHYVCVGCRKKFITSSELRAHCNVNPKCHRAVKPKLFRYWGLQSKADSIVRKRITVRRHFNNKLRIEKTSLIVNKKKSNFRQCPVCRRRVFRGSFFNKHIRSCIHNHRKQMHRTDK